MKLTRTASALLLLVLAMGTWAIPFPAEAQQQDPAQEARLLWSAGNQVGAAHWAAFVDDRDGTLKSLRNVVELYKRTACLDVVPWQRLLEKLEAGASARSIFTEITAQEDREMQTSGIDGYACSCRGRASTGGLAGHWSSFRAESPQSTFPARISQGSSLIVETLETRATGSLQGGNTLLVEGWGPTGTVSGDGNRINWTNGSIWIRVRHGMDLIGDWVARSPEFPGQLLAAKIFAAGPKLIVEDHQRHQGSAHLIENGDTLLAVDWNLRAAIVEDGRRINWSNGTVWVRTGAR